jgi:hypothetical protein
MRSLLARSVSRIRLLLPVALLGAIALAEAAGRRW